MKKIIIIIAIFVSIPLTTLAAVNSRQLGDNYNNPGYILQTNGATSTWVDASSLGISQWLNNGLSIYYNSGNVGIGTTTPATALTITSAGGSTLTLGDSVTSDGQISLWSGADGAYQTIIANDSAMSFSTLLEMNGFTSTGLVNRVDGNLGIGSTSPNAKLVVKNSGTQDALIVSSSSDSRLFTIDNAGKVGIGITPTSKLQIDSGMLRISGTTSFGSALSGSSILYRNSALGLVVAGEGSTNDLYVGNKNGTQVMTIPTGTTNVGFAGNVGIGTTAPGTKLQVEGGAIYADGTQNDNPYTGSVASANGQVDILGNQAYWAMRTAATAKSFNLDVYNGGSTKAALTVLQSGNVGIGTTTPSAKLHVSGTAGTSDIFTISSSTNARLLTVTAAGNVGIGTTTPGAKITVQDGDIYVASSTRGIILMSPDGTCARGTISDIDVLTFTSVTCP